MLGCIADDYTGATDIAGLLARSGVRVSLRMGVPSVPAALGDVVEFEVIALKSRTASVGAAVEETRAALAWLTGAGAEKIFWKYCSTFDSTKEGNIGPVAEALMEDLGVEQTIYCPAFPENGRSVYMGNLFVGDQPIAESPMKDHPLTPMRDSNLVRVLARQVGGKVGLANWKSVAEGSNGLRARINQLRSDGVGHVIVDAVSDSDLATIAETCMDMPLITGGSALAMPLPELYRQAGLLGECCSNYSAPELPKGQIVLSGSCSEMTQKQVAKYLDTAEGYQIDPIQLKNDGTGHVRRWLEHQDPNSPKIIYATTAPEAVRAAQDALGAENAGVIIEETLAQLALDARNMGVGRIVVAGGETSGAITKALGVTRLKIGSEIVPGVPWTYCTSDGINIALALKSGNFGQADFFGAAFEKLGST